MKIAHTELVRLLLVEDNRADVRLLQENLKDIDIPTHLDVVEDGEDALAFLRQQEPYANALRPDFILLDIYLPRKNGFQVLDELEHDPILRAIPLVICLGSGIVKQQLESYKLPADCFFVKSYDPAELKRILTHCRTRTSEALEA